MKSADPARPLARTWVAIRKWGPHVLGAILLVASAFVLWREFHAIVWSDLVARMAQWGWKRIAAATLFSALSFALLGVVEWMGLRWSGMPLPWRTAIVRSFMVNGITHSLGSSVVIAAAVRSWAYGRNGLRLAPSAMTSIFNAVSFSTGLALMVGIGLVFANDQQLSAVRLTPAAARLMAAASLGGVALYVVGCRLWPSRWRLFNTPAPSAGYAIGQVVLGAADNALAAAILWVLAGPDQLPFPTFVFAYALASVAAVMSHVPGGIGVFEASLASLLPQADPRALAAGFIGFRLVFYLAPLVGAVMLALVESAIRGRGRPR